MSDTSKTLIAATLAAITFVAVIAVILQSWAVLGYGLLSIVILVINDIRANRRDRAKRDREAK